MAVAPSSGPRPITEPTPYKSSASPLLSEETTIKVVVVGASVVD